MRIVKITLLMVVTSLATISFGQLKLGFTAGANYNMPAYSMSSQDTLTNPNQYRGAGAHFGFYSYLNLAGKSKAFGIQVEYLISTRNHRTYSESKEVVNEEIFYFRESHAFQKMMYIDFPTHLRYNLVFKKGKFGDVNMLGICLGVQTSIMIGSSYDVDHTYLTSVSGQQTILQESSNTPSFMYIPFEVGLSAGVLYEMQMGLRFGLRFYRSLTTAAFDDRLDIKHQLLMASVGFNFASLWGK